MGTSSWELRLQPRESWSDAGGGWGDHLPL